MSDSGKKETITLLSLEKENRMMGSSGSQIVFFKEDAHEALARFGFNEQEINKLMNNEFILRDEIMNFEYRYSISETDVFNVARKEK